MSQRKYSCDFCKSQLLVTLEQESGICYSCIPKRLAMIPMLTNQLDQITSALNECTAQRNELAIARAARLEYDQAEREGRSAAQRGIPLEDCPWPKDELAIFWKAGWYEGWKDSLIRQMQAVMLWTIDTLDYVKQISSPEVSAKLDTIVVKLAPFLTEWAERFEDGKEAGQVGGVQGTQPTEGESSSEAL